MFHLYVGVDPLTGKKQPTIRRGFKAKKEAKDALAALKVEINNGTYKRKSVETYQDYRTCGSITTRIRYKTVHF